jgi:hypothetical protein
VKVAVRTRLSQCCVVTFLGKARNASDTISDERKTPAARLIGHATTSR